MGLFRKVPDTIDDDRWAKIQRGANRTEAREGGMFSRKAVERRQTYSRILARAQKGQN